MKMWQIVSVLIMAGFLIVVPYVFSASLGPISEETPPAICDPGAIVSSVICKGKYCDNIQINCSVIGVNRVGSYYWTPWLSEENGGLMVCPQKYYIAGFVCSGKYCDNLSLLCASIPASYEINCNKTVPVSEEGRGQVHFFMGDKAGQRFAAKGMRCIGNYCDKKQFDVCELGLQ